MKPRSPWLSAIGKDMCGNETVNRYSKHTAPLRPLRAAEAVAIPSILVQPRFRLIHVPRSYSGQVSFEEACAGMALAGIDRK